MDMPMNAVNSIETVANRVERDVSEPQKDSMGRIAPNIGVLYEQWIPVRQVVERTRFTSAQGVIDAIHRGDIAGVKVGKKYRGEWRVDHDTIGEWLLDE